MIRRHTLVWLKHVPVFPDDALTLLCKKWQLAGNPFIVCRTRPGEEISLGLCLPPEDRHTPPQRVALWATMDDIARTSPPPTFQDVAAVVDKLPRNVPPGINIHVIGSYLWAHLTGKVYTRDDSDIDLLVMLANKSLAPRAIEYLRAADESCYQRLDGEISFAGLGEVSWRELASDSTEVLVKSIDNVRLLPREVLQ